MADAAKMPRYRCHKEVRAVRISDRNTIIGHTIIHADNSVSLAIDERDGGGMVRVEHAVVQRYFPQPGDYLVVYEPGGYRSISPRKVFEEGYARIPDDDA